MVVLVACTAPVPTGTMLACGVQYPRMALLVRFKYLYSNDDRTDRRRYGMS